MNKSRSIFIKKTKEWTEQEVSFVSEVLEHTFENTLNGNELNHEVSVLLTNDEEIRELNKKYRKIDRPTNVLSFSSGVNSLGELSEVSIILLKSFGFSLLIEPNNFILLNILI